MRSASVRGCISWVPFLRGLFELMRGQVPLRPGPFAGGFWPRVIAGSGDPAGAWHTAGSPSRQPRPQIRSAQNRNALRSGADRRRISGKPLNSSSADPPHSVRHAALPNTRTFAIHVGYTGTFVKFTAVIVPVTLATWYLTIPPPPAVPTTMAPELNVTWL